MEHDILCLPYEILDIICINLNGYSAIQLSFTCKRFCYFILSSRQLWKKYCLNDYGYEVSLGSDSKVCNNLIGGICFRCPSAHCSNINLTFYLKILTKYWKFIKNTNKRRGVQILLTFVKVKDNTPYLNWSLMVFNPEMADYTIYNLFSLAPLSCDSLNVSQVPAFANNVIEKLPRDKKTTLYFTKDNVELICKLCDETNDNCKAHCYFDERGHLMYYSSCLIKLWSSSQSFPRYRLCYVVPVVPLSRFIRKYSKPYIPFAQRKQSNEKCDNLGYGIDLLFNG